MPDEPIAAAAMSHGSLERELHDIKRHLWALHEMLLHVHEMQHDLFRVVSGGMSDEQINEARERMLGIAAKLKGIAKPTA